MHPRDERQLDKDYQDCQGRRETKIVHEKWQRVADATQLMLIIDKAVASDLLACGQLRNVPTAAFS
jgi:hypothetical protein